MAGTIPLPAPGAGGGLGGGAPTPDDLLAQIRDLLDQYLNMGGNTPVASEAQALADAIDQSSGAMGGGPDQMGADQGQPPPDMGGGPPPPDMGAGPVPQVPPEKVAGGAEPPPSNSKTFKGANVSAMDRLKKRNAKK